MERGVERQAMTVTIERDPEEALVAHCRLDFGQLNLLSPAAITELGEHRHLRRHRT